MNYFFIPLWFIACLLVNHKVFFIVSLKTKGSGDLQPHHSSRVLQFSVLFIYLLLFLIAHKMERMRNKMQIQCLCSCLISSVNYVCDIFLLHSQKNLSMVQDGANLNVCIGHINGFMFQNHVQRYKVGPFKGILQFKYHEKDCLHVQKI